MEKTDKFSKAYDKSLKLISLYPRSEKEIRNKLMDKYFEEEVIDRVVIELKETEYIDDKKYARIFIESQLKKKPCGRMICRKKLAGKGINESIVEEVIEPAYPQEKEIEYAREVANKKLAILNKPTKKKTGQALARFLEARGFSGDVVWRVLEKKGFIR